MIGVERMIGAGIEEFDLPTYKEIPDVGLFLEQTTKYIHTCLERLGGVSLTGSMISNYVKKHLIANPVKKQYSRDQIGYLIFIAVAKTVLSLDDTYLLVELQKRQYDPETAYEYFRRELKTVLLWVFGVIDEPEAVGTDKTEARQLLDNTIIAFAHKVYLDCYFQYLRQQGKERSAKDGGADQDR